MTGPATPGGQPGFPGPHLTDIDSGQEPFGWPLRPFLLGWALAAAAVLLVRWLGQSFLSDPCRGHTVLALLMPLLLGPGGLALTASQWNDRPKAMFGLGLVMASFVPSLLLSAYDIGQLRNLGCAGGYLIVAEPGGKQLSEITLENGQSRELQGRIGGYQRDRHPGAFQLSGQSMSGDLVIDLPKTVVHVGDVFPIRVRARDNAVSNRFDWGVQAKYLPAPGEDQSGDAAEIETSAKLAVTIVPRRSGK